MRPFWQLLFPLPFRSKTDFLHSELMNSNVRAVGVLCCVFVCRNHKDTSAEWERLAALLTLVCSPLQEITWAQAQTWKRVSCFDNPCEFLGYNFVCKETRGPQRRRGYSWLLRQPVCVLILYLSFQNFHLLLLAEWKRAC